MAENKFRLEVAGIKKEVTLQVEYFRFLFYGGAKNSGDNSAFHFASLNVMKDYNNDGNISRDAADSAKKIVNKINSQTENSIQSIDFFFHGDMLGLYMIKGSSIYKDISSEDVEDKNLNASLYLGKSSRFFKGSDLHKDSRVISDIDFSKFTKTCKIEIHGCLTAHNMYLKDNICEELSELLYSNGKRKAVVIGHTERANPNIKNRKYKDKKTGKIIEIKTKNREQDYRQGERIIFHNGNKILTTKKKGRISGKEINDVLPE
ncbi:hypothetical protein J2Q11_13700 [Tenacibaculum finnmarkense genomovar finnmarkense]|uniref:hypothetical protein n=1 Tax=Tenacibaculum finnmarkense TaxID=2781243 RepID=UPI001E518063|nr:hypothetical protein [Tenacibaculum finnmarkense]MCD8418777.1 hypothetical protein [Tenacibaculum finnmarkense genomovar finnmarkense]MCG8187079.1 hypothetical protein [Tenacibaculum finnmarkense genomovar finnmarkense]MCG8203626.1 hypothetical protein [Tenacibaculum finnmarkense genomovar finnmarkense]MCG8211116.1 hypothetical protein [Tenacibaculum finnmarkense genomovar finnmarkense]MCG8213871.1 hypothetical protein [Tenacibaculum finnmarkense genomovar finnmarkense]